MPHPSSPELHLTCSRDASIGIQASQLRFSRCNEPYEELDMTHYLSLFTPSRQVGYTVCLDNRFTEGSTSLPTLQITARDISGTRTPPLG